MSAAAARPTKLAPTTAGPDLAAAAELVAGDTGLGAGDAVAGSATTGLGEAETGAGPSGLAPTTGMGVGETRAAPGRIVATAGLATDDLGAAAGGLAPANAVGEEGMRATANGLVVTAGLGETETAAGPSGLAEAGAHGAAGAQRKIVVTSDVGNGGPATSGVTMIIAAGRDGAGGDEAVGLGGAAAEPMGGDGGLVTGGQAEADRMAARQMAAARVGAGRVGGDEGRVSSGDAAGERIGAGQAGGEWVSAGDVGVAEGRGAGGESQTVWVAPGVVATAYGPGGRWLLSQARSMLGLDDDVSRFDPSPHPLVKRLAHEHQGLRFPGTRLIFPRLLRNICEQKVTGKEAYRAYTAIVRYFGQKAPGPREDLLLPPDPQRVAKTPYYEFHPLGLERKRADTLRRAAFEMPRLERCGSSAELTRRLTSIPGIGVWTAAEVVRIVFGDPDAVSVGDYHMKNIVSWALAGEPRGTDERMLELLEPFRGHRGRVCLLLEAAGIGAPRYGPRMPIREFHTW